MEEFEGAQEEYGAPVQVLDLDEDNTALAQFGVVTQVV